MGRITGLQDLVKCLEESSSGSIGLSEEVWVPKELARVRQATEDPQSMMGLLKAARRGWIESFLGLVGRERKLVMQQGSVDELAEVGLGWCFINRLFSSPGVEGTLHMSIDSLSDSNGCYAVEPRLSGMDDGRRRIGYCVVEYTTEDGKRVSKTFNFDGDTLPFELASAVVEFMP